MRLALSSVNPVRPWLTLALIACLSSLCGWGCDQHAEDKEAIQLVVDSHAKAYSARDGAAVVKLMSRNTFDHYERLLRLALEGSRSQIVDLRAWDRLEVIRMRVRSTRKILKDMDGRKYAQYSCKEGWFDYGDDPEDVLGTELTNFKFAPPDTAYAQPRGGRRNRALPFRYTFIKEPDGWKYDEISSYDHWSAELEQEARSARRDTTEFLIEMIADETGKKVQKDILDRPMR